MNCKIYVSERQVLEFRVVAKADPQFYQILLFIFKHSDILVCNSSSILIKCMDIYAIINCY